MSVTKEKIQDFLKNPSSKKLNGYYNDNYIIEDGGKKYLLRVPISDAVMMDIKLFNECDLLSIAARYELSAPKILYQFELDNHKVCYIHEYINGETVEELFPENSEMPQWIADAVAREIAKIHTVRANSLCDMVGALPWKMNSRSLYEYIYKFNRGLIDKYWQEYRNVYMEFGFPNSVDEVITLQSDRIRDEEFCMCHTDVHRKNVIVDTHLKKVTLIDWELAFIATPAYDLSINMHKMRYTRAQDELFLKEYCRSAKQSYVDVCEQVELFRALEEVKSVSIDVVRYLGDIEKNRVSKDEAISYANRYYTKLVKAYKRWNYSKCVDEERIKAVFLKNYGK